MGSKTQNTPAGETSPASARPWAPIIMSVENDEAALSRLALRVQPRGLRGGGRPPRRTGGPQGPRPPGRRSRSGTRSIGRDC